MAYEKQNFEAGQILTAAQMNHIEDGIEQVEKGMPAALPSPNKISFLNKTDKSVAAEYDGSAAAEVELVDDGHIESVVKPIITWENVMNKPFGQVGKAGLVLDSVSVALDDGAGPITQEFTLKEKANYMVIYDGKYYECTGIVYTLEVVEAVWIGNLAAIGSSDAGNADAPFLIGCLSDEDAAEQGARGVLFDFSGSTSVIVGIRELDTFVPMDEGLIPDTIARLTQVEAMIDAKIAELKGTT